jgi:hypothetical protein
MISGLGSTLTSIFFCELQAIEWQLLQLSSPTGNIVWMALRRGEEEPRIDSAEVDMP